MTNLIYLALGGLMTFGGFVAQSDFPLLPYDNPICRVITWNRICADLEFGATFPASLDSFENPSGTGLVSTTVTHSAHHTNANEAIELIESKLGTGSSTSSTNTLLAGNGAGTSVWTTHATTTNLQSTNIVAMGSTTLQNFTATNGTTTNATSTAFHVSGLASTTALRSNTATIGSETVGVSTINSLTVSGSCSGCTTGTVAVYTATSTATGGTNFKTSLQKSLNLVSGDLVLFGGSKLGGSSGSTGNLTYKITSPWDVATTTTCITNGAQLDSSCQYTFLATTTETVIFTYAGVSSTDGYSMWIIVQPSGYGNIF